MYIVKYIRRLLRYSISNHNRGKMSLPRDFSNPFVCSYVSIIYELDSKYIYRTEILVSRITDPIPRKVIQGHIPYEESH